MADDKKRLLDSIKLIQQQNEELNKQRNNLNSIYDIDKRRAIESEIAANNQLLYTQRLRLEQELKEKNIDLTADERKELDNILGKQKGINDQLDKEYNRRQKVYNLTYNLTTQLKLGWDYLQQSDKIIRQTILNLGMSGVKAEMMRNSFEQSAVDLARMGGSLEDIQSIMTGYADETGRARVLTADMVTDIAAIGKGTAIGIEAATRLGAQFELMGLDAKKTVDYVQSVVDTSERMGVNTTKVLKNVNDNFKRLNTYTFQQGVKGYAQMAMYAEKMKVDMNAALNAADVARSLEGAVDLAAQLQVMGGEFAKTDPFEMLFLSRNDPAKFTEKISDMTKGVVSFRKMADGTFEKFISPADRDRLAAVAKSLGMEASELTQVAERTAEIQKMRQQMLGTGLSAKDKQIVEGMAFFNTQLGVFQVKVGEQVKNLANLTDSDAKLLQTQSVALKKRAEDALTFEESFKATVAELKSALLPILQAVNKFLVWIKPMVQNFTDLFTKGPGAWAKSAALLITAGIAWKTASAWFSASIDNLVSNKSLFQNKSMTNASTMAAGTENMTANAASNPNAGKGLMRGGAGIGAAALGIGAGIGVAAAGIGKLADSMSKLTKDQAETLQSIVKSLGWFVVGGAIAAAAIIALGTSSMAAAPGLGALTLAALGIGTAIGIAGAGVGAMALGLGTMIEKSKGAGTAMLQVAAGMGAMSLAMMGFTAGALGLITFSATMNKIANNADAMNKVGYAFEQINVAMKGSKDDYVAVADAVERISKANFKGGGVLTELRDLLNKPLRVEFDNAKASFTTEVNLNMDGKRIFAETFDAKVAASKTVTAKNGIL